MSTTRTTTRLRPTAVTTPGRWPSRPDAAEARLPLDHPATLGTRLLGWWSRRRYGQELQPMLALLHNRRVAATVGGFELGVERWRALDPDLKELASLAAAARIGCTWCIDFGYYLSRTRGMSREKLEQALAWRSSAVFTPLERKVLEYAEAMTATPPEVTGEMVAGLRADLGDAQLVELTAIVAVENQRSRTNSALGLSSQGFRAQCDLPA